MSGIKFKNLSFSYEGKEVFNNLNFTLRKDKSLSIISPSGHGKTTLLKLLNNELLYSGEITINGLNVDVDNVDKTNEIIKVVFRNSKFICETVKDELLYGLNQNNVSKKEIENRLDDINLFFNIKHLYNCKLVDLNDNDRILIKILSYAIMEPSYIALDDLFLFLNNRTEILLLNYLNYKNIILINVTSDLEDVLYTDYVLCLFDGKSAIDGKTIDVLKNEKILKRLGFSLPFMVDLSIQLQAYNLISKMYLNKEAMVRNLWK